MKVVLNINFLFLINIFLVPKRFFEECFAENHTIMHCCPYPRFGTINRVCKELQLRMDFIFNKFLFTSFLFFVFLSFFRVFIYFFVVGKHKRSVPKQLDNVHDIREFLTLLKHDNAKEWKKLKIVFLGHGEVGKTSLLHAIQWLQSQHVCLLFFTSLRNYLCPLALFFFLQSILITSKSIYI